MLVGVRPLYRQKRPSAQSGHPGLPVALVRPGFYREAMTTDGVSGAARRLMDDIDVRALAEEADEPHSVIAYDPMTESYTVTGPFADAHVATVEAERIKAELNEAAGHPDYPPIQTWIAMHFQPGSR